MNADEARERASLSRKEMQEEEHDQHWKDIQEILEEATLLGKHSVVFPATSIYGDKVVLTEYDIEQLKADGFIITRTSGFLGIFPEKIGISWEDQSL